MDRTEKEALVASLNRTFLDSRCIVVTRQTGLTVAEVSRLRRDMREAGAGFKVAKNTLVRLALVGTSYEGLKDLFTGPTAICASADPVAAAKIIVQFAKGNDKLTILGGAMPGTILGPDGVQALATLPSLDELRGKLIGLIQAPATKIAGVLQAPAGQLARVFQAYADRDKEAA